MVASTYHLVTLVLLSLLSLTSCTEQCRSQAANPMSGHRFYLNREYILKLRYSMITATTSERIALRQILTAPTAVWVTKRSHVNNSRPQSAAHHLKQAARMSLAPLITFVVYNLPNRDCAAGASFGELCCFPGCNKLRQDGTCKHGLHQYMKEFIDPLARTVNEYCGKVPMAFVIEPDSLPNMVTNFEDKRCGNSTGAAYREGVKYAVTELHKACGTAPLYLDAAHGGWLGWEANSEGFAKEVKGLGIWKKLRGFAANVANYQEMGVICPEVGFCLDGMNPKHICCRMDACGLADEGNPGHTALNYVVPLRKSMKAQIPRFDPKFIIDTSRNGVADARETCSNFCNVRDAGVGQVATTGTADPAIIDAYFWVKPPGESDGCTKRLPTGELCPRFVEECVSDDSIGSEKREPRAPEAGDWFDYQIKRYAERGNAGMRGKNFCRRRKRRFFLDFKW